MKRSLAALCVLPLSVSALADVTYTVDSRFVQSVNSFGQNTAHTPPAAFAPFHDVAHVSSSLPEGSCGAVSTHDSVLGPAQMSGSGTVSSNASTATQSALVFAGSGTSRFEIAFKPDADGSIRLTGQMGGTAGKSTLLAQLKLGGNILFSKTTSGTFDFQTISFADAEYTLTVSCAANSLLMWTGSPASTSSESSFSFVAELQSSACTGDLNDDGVVDDLDFTIFVPAYNLLDCADPTMPAGCPADLNEDGVVDDLDFILFVPAYDALVCP